MRNKLLLLAAAALAVGVAAPASAQPGHGKHHGKSQAKKWDGRDDRRGDWRDDDRRGDYRNCPPGLAKRRNGCQPPGQARKAAWGRGSYLPRGYSNWSRYDSIPRAYRSRVPYDQRYRYVYQDNYVYTVDPRTRAVRSVIDLLSGR